MDDAERVGVEELQEHTSAFLKTVLVEPQSAALTAYLTAFESPRFVSSALLAVEARRSVLRAEPASLPRLDLELLGVIQINMTEVVLEPQADCRTRCCAPSTRSMSQPPCRSAKTSRRW